MRFARRLVSFERVWLDPAASERVSLAFDVAEALGRYDEFCREWHGGSSCTPGWVTDPGIYGLHVGDCCVSGVVNSTETCANQISTTLRVAE